MWSQTLHLLGTTSCGCPIMLELSPNSWRKAGLPPGQHLLPLATNVEQLQIMLVEQWDYVSQDEIQTLIYSMPRRPKALRKVRGRIGGINSEPGGAESRWTRTQSIMERWVGKVAVVTGASSGIGHAVAITLANHGMKVVAVARRLQRLKDLAAEITGKGTILPFAADVTIEEEVVEMIKTAEREFGACHVLVNNAGVAFNTKVLEGDMEKWKGMFELNVLAPGAATREAITSMLKNDIDDGHIINISSISAHHPPTDVGKHVYNATKHALRVITEGVRAELTNMKSNIKISMVSPGVVATEIFAVGGWDKTYDIEHIPTLESQDVANGVVAVLATPPNVLVTEYVVRPMKERVFA